MGLIVNKPDRVLPGLCEIQPVGIGCTHPPEVREADDIAISFLGMPLTGIITQENAVDGFFGSAQVNDDIF